MEKTPIEMLADLLAEMTTRATNAERELVETKKSEDSWYKLYVSEKAERTAISSALESERAAHAETKSKLEKEHFCYKPITGGVNNESE